MTNFSQQQPINTLKPLSLSTDKGSLSYILIGQTLVSEKQIVFSLSLQKLALHFVTPFHFGKQCRVKNTAAVSYFSKLNWDALKLTSLKHKILFLQCYSYINIVEILLNNAFL